MKSKIPAKARVYHVIRKVAEFIKKNNINTLPVDPFMLYRKNNYILLSKEEAKKLYGNLPFSIKDARTMYAGDKTGNGYYITIYNESVFTYNGEICVNRIRWTLAHELGHIFLEHLITFPEITQSLSYSEYNVLEEEANRFAAELLAPMNILKILNINSREKIQSLCKISSEAALNRAKELKWWGDQPIYDELNSFYYTQFRNLFKQNRYSRNYFSGEYDFV